VSKQIAVRLPDDLVEFLDDLVARGDVATRATAVTQAVERARRRETAARDAAILVRATEDTDDLEGLAEFAARAPMDDLA
jgi:Arc/MetJ-type ribon-helix-helix transcriptional regulator